MVFTWLIDLVKAPVNTRWRLLTTSTFWSKAARRTHTAKPVMRLLRN